MMNLIYELLGSKYVFHGYGLILTFLESQLCMFLLSHNLQKRYGFWIRVLVSFLEGILCCYLLAIWFSESETLPTRIVCYLMVAVLNFLILLFCYEDALEDILLVYSCGLAIYQIGNKLYPLLQNLNGINDRATLSLIHDETAAIQGWEWILFFVFRIAVYIILITVFRPKDHLSNKRKIRRNITILSVSTIAVVHILVSIARFFEPESMTLSMILKVFTIAFAFFVLLMGAGIFEESENDKHVEILHQLMHQEQAQFESVKANMDSINMKCHDLKHIFHQIENKLSVEEKDALSEAIQFYDASIKTGNEVLDIVLCEKAIQCKKNNIRFSCMVDGTLLSFLTSVQLYSLFGNILDNAIEAVDPISSPDMRTISLTCLRRNGKVVIEESNYFTGDLKLVNGIPSTTKQDTARHGFGTRSIRYIAEQYNGNLMIRIVDNMFFLTVSFDA